MSLQNNQVRACGLIRAGDLVIHKDHPQYEGEVISIIAGKASLKWYDYKCEVSIPGNERIEDLILVKK